MLLFCLEERGHNLLEGVRVSPGEVGRAESDIIESAPAFTLEALRSPSFNASRAAKKTFSESMAPVLTMVRLLRLRPPPPHNFRRAAETCLSTCGVVRRTMRSRAHSPVEWSGAPCAAEPIHPHRPRLATSQSTSADHTHGDRLNWWNPGHHLWLGLVLIGQGCGL